MTSVLTGDFRETCRSRGQDSATDGLVDHKERGAIALVAREFDVFVTVDRNLSFQQNLPAFAVAVIVIRARSNRLADLKPLVPELLSCIQGARRGAVDYVGG